MPPRKYVDPWYSAQYLEQRGFLISEMDGQTIRIACYGAKLITRDEDRALADLAGQRAKHNEELLQKLQGSGMEGFQIFLRILHDKTAEVKFRACLTALDELGPRTEEAVVDPKPPQDSVYNGSASFADTSMKEDLVDDLQRRLNPNQRRNLAKEIVLKYTPKDQNDFVMTMRDFGDDNSDLKGRNEVTNIHISLAFASHHSITRQEVYDLLQKVCPESKTRFMEIFSKAEP